MSSSFKQSKMVDRWRCTALWSTCTVRSNVFNATYLWEAIQHSSTMTNNAHLMFLSLLTRKRPRILMAKTLSPLSLLISIIVITVSYRMAWPTFFPDSVLVATYSIAMGNSHGNTRHTWAKISFICSLQSLSPLPSIRSNLSICTCVALIT